MDLLRVPSNHVIHFYICCVGYVKQTDSLADEKLYVFGSNEYNQYGFDHVNSAVPLNLEFFNGKKIQQIEGALSKLILAGNTILLIIDDIIYGFGYNGSGELGLGNGNYQKTPVEIKFFKGKKIEKIRCGKEHSFVLACIEDEDSQLYGFGNNEDYQLGFLQSEKIFYPKLLPHFQDKRIKDGMWRLSFICTFRFV